MNLDGIFDPVKAKQIRIDLRINRRKLARELGATGVKVYSFDTSIYEYETGRRVPKPNSTELQALYLLWLKEQSYDPYGI